MVETHGQGDDLTAVDARRVQEPQRPLPLHQPVDDAQADPETGHQAP
jgi:hypothetical protein